jgi:hypothetical protein
VNVQDITGAIEQIEYHQANHDFFIVTTQRDGVTLYFCSKPSWTRWSDRLGYALAGGAAFSFWMSRESAVDEVTKACATYKGVALADVQVVPLPGNALRALREELERIRPQPNDWRRIVWYDTSRVGGVGTN